VNISNCWGDIRTLQICLDFWIFTIVLAFVGFIRSLLAFKISSSSPSSSSSSSSSSCMFCWGVSIRTYNPASRVISSTKRELDSGVLFASRLEHQTLKCAEESMCRWLRVKLEQFRHTSSSDRGLLKKHNYNLKTIVFHTCDWRIEYNRIYLILGRTRIEYNIIYLILGRTRIEYNIIYLILGRTRIE